MSRNRAAARQDDRYRRRCRDKILRACLIAAMLASAGCEMTDTPSDQAAGKMPPAQRDSLQIDQYYLRTVALLKQPDRLDPDDIHQLTMQVDALPTATDTRDPCLAQKRRQLLPILMSLAVIDGISDVEEQQALRAEALHRLVRLGSPHEPSMDGDLCFGRGFPPVML
ncbi:MAG TPA: hypothetical protein VN229_23885, partial [Terriglobales bacterium]|nr:hypothetical protein [Terriglobales bacterium]